MTGFHPFWLLPRPHGDGCVSWLRDVQKPHEALRDPAHQRGLFVSIVSAAKHEFPIHTILVAARTGTC
jgi:hypothetical protein